ncbi:murein biosynthesis integral membrane protein MurJ [bacterium]|nr:murein biosynthesis integral membrane protein MurJ [bacterium]
MKQKVEDAWEPKPNKKYKGSIRGKGLLSKMSQVSGSTLLSRVLGIIREIVLGRYLGVGVLSDTFFVAYSIPNSLRKVFAEGALSASFIPSFVRVLNKKGVSPANKLMTLAFLFFEGIVLLLCYVAMWHARTLLGIIVPGWSPELIAKTVPYLRILMPFIFFISSSALLSGALNSVHHFFVPAFSPAMLNIVFISAVLVCTYFGLPIDYLCYAILFGGFLQFVAHVVTYIKCSFSFEFFDNESLKEFGRVMAKFIPCMFAMSIVEVSFFIDRIFASYLPSGSISLLYYGGSFMRIPLGVFGVAFAVVTFPVLARIAIYAPKRLGYLLCESTKFLFWIMIPFSLLMMFFAKDIFYTLFISRFSIEQVFLARQILIAYLCGLFFFSINKILLNTYYSLHNTILPALISIAGVVVNVILNFILIYFFKATGLALATSLGAGLFQTAAFLYVLKKRFNLPLYETRFLLFARNFAVQLSVLVPVFLVLYYLCESCIRSFFVSWQTFFLCEFGLWLWVGPLVGVIFLLMIFTRRFFGIKIYFID